MIDFQGSLERKGHGSWSMCKNGSHKHIHIHIHMLVFAITKMLESKLQITNYTLCAFLKSTNYGCLRIQYSLLSNFDSSNNKACQVHIFPIL